MRKGKKVLKQVLHLAKYPELTPNKNDEFEEIVSSIKELKKKNHIIFGINSVNKQLLQHKVQYVVFPENPKFDEFIQPTLSLIKQQSIPIIVLSKTPQALGSCLGLKTCACIGITSKHVPEAIESQSQLVRDEGGLPLVRVDVDSLSK